ncbi:MAG: hypothetical protein M1814_003562 [Vezdaea aestivalis]|nr:MAG: hypothetical protein M1814_003562 [Vezdaea aestivalis]
MSLPQRLHPRSAARPLNPAKQRMQLEAQNMQVFVNDKARRFKLRIPPYEFLELIGKGSFGRVFKCKERKSNMIVAIKILDADKADSDPGAANDSLTDFLKEVKTLKTLRGQNARNINMIFEAFAFDTAFWIISQYCPGGSVHTLMKCRPVPGIEERYYLPIARELAEAIHWVHGAGIIHRDIKAANVLITEEGKLQLCDFGVAAMLEHKVDKRSTVLGTPWWMAPEMNIGAGPWVPVSYGKEVDVWAFGCTVYEMVTGFPPNCRVQPEKLGQTLLEKVPRLEPGPSVSEGAREMVAFCLQMEPTVRPPIQAVRSHPWLRDSDSTFPTGNLAGLVREFYLWEQAGGQRQSLLMPGGAPGVDLPSGAPPIDDGWNFSTSDKWDLSFHGPEDASSSGVERPSSATSVGQPTSVVSFDKGAMAQPLVSGDEPSAGNAGHRARRGRGPKHPLQRMFDEDDPTNYAERHKNFLPPIPTFPQQSAAARPPPSDLPMRNQHPQGSVRDTTIDLGEFDPESGSISIPDFRTIRESRVRLSRKFQDAEMGGADQQPLEFGVAREGEDEYGRRVTREWRFPTAPEEEEDMSTARPKTRDWKFPAMQDEGLQGESTSSRPRPKTQDWKFPTAISTDDDTSLGEYAGPVTARPPRPPPAAVIRPRLISQNTAAPLPTLPYGVYPSGEAYQQTASAPVSPPESMIDLDEAELVRPSTSSGSRPEDEYEAYPSSASYASDQTSAFGLDNHLEQNPIQQAPPPAAAPPLASAEEQGLGTIRPPSTSSHRQSLSVPPSLDTSTPAAKASNAAQPSPPKDANDPAHRRQSSLDDSGWGANEKSWHFRKVQQQSAYQWLGGKQQQWHKNPHTSTSPPTRASWALPPGVSTKLRAKLPSRTKLAKTIKTPLPLKPAIQRQINRQNWREDPENPKERYARPSNLKRLSNWSHAEAYLKSLPPDSYPRTPQPQITDWRNENVMKLKHSHQVLHNTIPLPANPRAIIGLRAEDMRERQSEMARILSEAADELDWAVPSVFWRGKYVDIGMRAHYKKDMKGFREADWRVKDTVLEPYEDDDFFEEDEYEV